VRIEIKGQKMLVDAAQLEPAGEERKPRNAVGRTRRAHKAMSDRRRRL
jgi:hypothetical protein